MGNPSDENNTIESSVFEQMNSTLLLIRNHPQEQSSMIQLIDQVIRMNSILHKLYDKAPMISEDALRSSVDSHRSHLASHDKHLQAHDEHLAILSSRLDSLKK